MTFANATAQNFQPQTQKAKSIYALKYASFKTPAFTVNTAKYYEANPDALSALIGKFVRPCPMHPRHGFVDSRSVSSISEAAQVIRETLDADADGEVIAMPYVSAEYSAIFTDGLIAVAPGTDGATMGKDCKVIPVIGNPSSGYWDMAKSQAGITEAPYCEILFRDKGMLESHDVYLDSNWETFYVQLRNGPKLPNTPDYIPATMKVTEVIYARAEGTHLYDAQGKEIDLLAWESTAIELSKRSGVCVYHPNGTLASHCAVHCFINNVPVITTFKPEPGMTIEKTSDKAVADVEQMKAGFVLGCNARMNYCQAAFAMLAAAHLTSVWLGKVDFLLGFGMGCAYRLTVAAGLGEYRHRNYCILHKGSAKKSRNSVYKSCWNKTLTPSTRQRFLKALDSFQNEGWGSSFGGKKWYAFCAFAAETYNALLANDATKALASFNQTVHAAHNGGWAFDKFIKEQTMNEAASNPCATVLKCAPDLYEAMRIADENKTLAQWFKYRCKISVSVDETMQHTLALFYCNNCGYKSKNTEYDSCPKCGFNEESGSCDTENTCTYCGYDLSDCTCNKNTPASGKDYVFPGNVTHVQAKIKNGMLHVQYKTNDASMPVPDYASKDLKIKSNSLHYVQAAIEANPNKVKSLYQGNDKSHAADYVVCAKYGVSLFTLCDNNSHLWIFDLNGTEV